MIIFSNGNLKIKRLGKDFVTLPFEECWNLMKEYEVLTHSIVHVLSMHVSVHLLVIVNTRAQLFKTNDVIS